MSAQLDSCMFVVMSDFRDPVYGYQLLTMWKGFVGLYPVPNFFLGQDFDLAVEVANQMNLEEGHEPEFVSDTMELATGLNNIHFFEA